VTVPSSTYRLQLRPEFGFDDAAAIVPYLADLGVTHVYCSPYLQAATGSTHGYDVVDHSRVNDELGGPEAHVRFCAALAAAGLGQVLDIVPNHMAIASGNAWWWDVLENGPASRYASYFDVDWDPPEAKLRNTVLMPILGDHYGRVLEAGEIELVFDRADAWFSVRYVEHRLPVAPPSIDELLILAASACDHDELAFVAAGFGRLPRATATDRASTRRRQREAAVLRAQLARLVHGDDAIADAITDVVATVNTDVDVLDHFLERQNYRLAHWRTAGQELDYRRFFDINGLAGLRTEDDEVFEVTHGLVLGWLRHGVLDGVRVDHVDGLRRPGEYLDRLRAAASRAWVLVEKILEPGEQLPAAWACDGTTGYDAMNMVTGVMVDPDAEKPFTDLYVELTADRASFDDTAWEAKCHVLDVVLAADVHRVVEQLVRVCEANRRYRDFTRVELRAAVRALLAAFPVYRTYPEGDHAPLDVAVRRVLDRGVDVDPELLEFLRSILAGTAGGELEDELRAHFEQLCGPVMAKGVEDTAFYRYLRLVALNEVGGSPDRFGVDVATFHSWCGRLAERWPRTMTTLSTHDTKRSEDVRARLLALTEVPDEWAVLARRWVGAGADGHGLDAVTTYGLFQNLVGAWPISPERFGAFAEKATREAKLHTSWTDPNPEYDDAVQRWVRDRLAEPSLRADLDAFVGDVVGEAGRRKSLAQKLVQLTMPGVPDVYQGCEDECFALVDPDNRRPVDYDRLRGVLGTPDEPVKLRLVREVLHLRRRVGDLGGYVSLDAPPDVVAFARGEGVVTIVPRFTTRSVDLHAELPPGQWRDVLPGFPVRLLERTS
jgi:(1->4)-alpha-D-glucan 1-alpha-D-glucosylmutase